MASFSRKQNAQALLDPLRNLWNQIIGQSSLAVIHSSLISFKFPLNGLKKVMIESLIELTERGITIVLPTFTFSFCEGRPFHHERSKSETGILGQWTLESGEAIRTCHPIYSFAVLGPKSDAIFSCPSTTTFGDDSPFGYFEKMNAVFIMMGCGWIACTQFHRYEEIARVPYRFFKKFSGNADYGNGNRRVCAKMYVRDLEINPKMDFSSVEKVFRKTGVLLSEEFAGGKVESVKAENLGSISRNLLNKNPLIWIKNQEGARQILTERE